MIHVPAAFSQKHVTLWRWLLSVVLIGGFVSLACAQTPIPPEPPGSRTKLVVTGTGEVKVAPDEALLRLKIETRNADLEEGKRQHEAQLQNVMKLLAENGVPAKNVRNDFLRVSPNSRQDDPGVRPNHYRVSRLLTVQLQALDKFDVLLAALLKSGTAEVKEVEFRVTKLDEHREAARLLAVASAKKKAEQLTRALGVRVGKPLEITENSSDGLPRSASVDRLKQLSSASMESVSGGADAVTSESEEPIPVSSTVQITFALE